MELLVSIAASAVTEAGKFMCGSYPNIKSFIRFRSNLSSLEKKMTSLLDLRNKLIEDVDSPDAQIIQWHQEVEQIMLEVNSVQAETSENNEGRSGCLVSCRGRCRLSSEVSRMLQEVERLMKQGNTSAKMAGRNYLSKAVEHIPGPCIQNETTASILTIVMDLLNNSDVSRIGIWGMGGVGKTTLVKNLNNKLKESSSMLHFGIVIWATVSQKLDLRKVQMQIAQRINLEVRVDESEESLAKRLHCRLSKERFLLILDDVWEMMDLDSIGVPQPEDHSGSKIILTSRSLEVCRMMKTGKQVKVDVLNNDESWQLFTENAGKAATAYHIEPIARAVAGECGGLPLAIITVGKAMREKTRIELWKDALSELKSSYVPDIEGIETRVFKPLKLSYDSLQGKNIKPCFLYCSLYPEDFSIDASELVKCWLGESLIEGQKNCEESYNRGMTLIEKLKDSCLLEPGAQENTVKMHDVVRNVALWISSCSEDGCAALVQSGIGLTQITESIISAAHRRISFMHNKLTELPDSEICRPETTSLLLQGNRPLDRIPDEFLRSFQSLKVLNLGGTCIKLLPQSIHELGGLRVLLLKDCSFLEDLSPVGSLCKLQVLDCSGTFIKELPSEMKNLRSLRELHLFRTLKLVMIQRGIMKNLSSLEVLDMTLSAYTWGLENEQANFEELLCLKHLLMVSIRFKGIPDVDIRRQSWILTLIKFQFVMGPYQTAFWQTKLDGKRVTAVNLDISSYRTNLMFKHATSLVLDSCEQNEMLGMWIIPHTNMFVNLKSLSITNSTWEHKGDKESKLDLLPNLEELHLLNVKELCSISDFSGTLGLHLSRLRVVEITKCPQLRFLFLYGNTKLYTKRLEVIQVSLCNNLYRLFRHIVAETEPQVSPVPNLQTIEVKNCNLLTKLPLRDLNTNSIQEIRGDEVWWMKLEQSSKDDTKEHLKHVFKPVKDEKPQFARTVTGFVGPSSVPV